MVLLGDLLSAQVFFDRHGIIGAAFDRRVVGDDDTLLPFDQPNTSDNAGRRRIIVVHIPGRQRTEFQERCTGIAKELYAFSCQELIAFAVSGDGCRTPALLDLLYPLL